MNWRLFGWLAALFGGAIIAIWLVATIIGAAFAFLGGLIKFALVVGIIGVIGWFGYKGYKAIGGSERRQIRK
ncbi:hypothetical protein [Glycomyces endophyticus]